MKDAGRGLPRYTSSVRQVDAILEDLSGSRFLTRMNLLQ